MQRQNKRTLADSFAYGKTSHPIHYKKTAYNWLNFCTSLPPCFGKNGEAISHTKFGTIYAKNAEDEAAILALLNGKIQLAYWIAVGDDFDVTSWMFADLPIDISKFDARTNADLLQLSTSA